MRLRSVGVVWPSATLQLGTWMDRRDPSTLRSESARSVLKVKSLGSLGKRHAAQESPLREKFGWILVDFFVTRTLLSHPVVVGQSFSIRPRDDP